VLGETGLAEYRRLATDAWEKIPPYSGGRMQKEEQEEFTGNQHQLMRVLDFFAERAGEVDTRIALRAKDLSSPRSYFQLAEFCLSHGREKEALRHAEEGLWVFEDGAPDQRLVLLAAELLSKAGRKGDAEAHLQRAFEKEPSLELYKRLCNLGGEAARQRAVKFLDEAGGKKIRWHNPSDLLVRIWMHEKMFEAAWATVRKHGASMVLKEELAGASDATHPAEALEVYTSRVEHLVSSGGGYEEAAKLVARMATLRGRGEQVAYVLSLKVRFGRRRNFMKLLE
jgi:tetratricopeptide (TPR) repeat protein